MASSTSSSARRRRSGFTLIEAMITVAIIAVIAAVAFPSYRNSVRKSHRADAMAVMATIQQAQERWRGNNSTYSTSLTDLQVTEPALYSLSITAPDSTTGSIGKGYAIIAQGREAQADDGDCTRLSVRLLDGNVSYGSCASCSTFTYSTRNACWNR